MVAMHGSRAAASSTAATPQPRRGRRYTLGPGLITGAADDDPSGIATFSQVGARFGFDVLWTVALTYPLMVAVQTISARIGAASGRGLATNMRRCFAPAFLHALVLLLCLANIVNIGADLSAMGAAAALLAGGPAWLYAIALGSVSLLLQIRIPYHRYVHYLKWLTVVLFAYVAVAFVERVPWRDVAVGALRPNLQWRAEYVTALVAILGTTISPYLFFWQASQEVEEQQGRARHAASDDAPPCRSDDLRRIRFDTLVGMGVSNVIAFFIMLSAAVTLHAHGVTTVENSAQAATALRPLAGEAAYLLFSLGIVGTGMLALPVLAGSAAYAVAGALQWRNGLELPWREAARFYAVIGACTVLGMALVFVPVDPMRALFWSAVLNGVVAVPVMVAMMSIAARRDIMGEARLGGALRAGGWLATVAMAAAVVAMLIALAMQRSTGE